MFCRQRGFLGAEVELDERRLAALAPGTSPTTSAPTSRRSCASRRATRTAGAIAALPASERFGWLVAPSSTIIQPSEVHTGLTDDPQATLDSLFAELVEPVAAV